MQEIGLQDVIYQVKDELLAPNPAQRAKDPYPLFIIDKVELEIAVKVTHTSSGGMKLTVIDFAEVSAGRSVEQEHGHLVKVSLAPLLSKSAILARALADERVRQMVETDSARAFVKGDEASLVGTPE